MQDNTGHRERGEAACWVLEIKITGHHLLYVADLNFKFMARWKWNGITGTCESRSFLIYMTFCQFCFDRPFEQMSYKGKTTKIYVQIKLIGGTGVTYRPQIRHYGQHILGTKSLKEITLHHNSYCLFAFFTWQMQCIESNHHRLLCRININAIQWDLQTQSFQQVNTDFSPL